MSAVSNFVTPVRVILGDREEPYMFDASAIADAVRLVVRCGEVPGYAMATGDENSITPDVAEGSDYGLLVYSTAVIFPRSNPSLYSWKSRAITERWGNWDRFIADLEERIHSLRNGVPLQGWQTAYGFIPALEGVSLSRLLTEVEWTGGQQSMSL